MNFKDVTERELFEYYKFLYMQGEKERAEDVLRFLQENYNEAVEW